jgi:hypothetical protein
MTAEETTYTLTIMQRRVGYLKQSATACAGNRIVRRQGAAAGAFASKERVDDGCSTTNANLYSYCPERTIALTRAAFNTCITITYFHLPIGHSKD